tara:strand:- start:463 stop:948 length:486 start_codon:yes stop_codon:yes gene_type:complete
MKLTNKQLKQIIKEELQSVLKEVYYRPPEFNVSASKQYPEYEDKLGELYKNDPNQARELSGALDEPIDVNSPEWGEFSDTHRIKQDLMSISGMEELKNASMEYMQFIQEFDFPLSSHKDFTNEKYLKAFGHTYGKEKEGLVRSAIRNAMIKDFFNIRGQYR